MPTSRRRRRCLLLFQIEGLRYGWLNLKLEYIYNSFWRWISPGISYRNSVVYKYMRIRWLRHNWSIFCVFIANWPKLLSFVLWKWKLLQMLFMASYLGHLVNGWLNWLLWCHTHFNVFGNEILMCAVLHHAQLYTMIWHTIVVIININI